MMKDGNKLPRRFLTAFLLLTLVVVLGGCSLTRSSSDKVRDLEFTLVPEAEVPEELQKLIDSKKKNNMALSFLDEGALYLAIGYGVQKSTGYSIGVEELYLTENGIVVDTTLIGPAKGEDVTEVESFPYVVIRTERREEPVTFQ